MLVLGIDMSKNIEKITPPNKENKSLVETVQLISQRGAELLKKWLDTDAIKISPEEAFERDFFSADNTDISSFDSRMQKLAAASTVRRLMTGLTLLGGIELLAIACHNDETSSESSEQASTNTDLTLEYSTSSHSIEIGLPDEHRIIIMDYNQADGAAWNIALPEIVGDEADSVLETNSAYGFHAAKFFERVNVSGIESHLITNNREKALFPWQKTPFSLQPESGRLQSGLNVGFDTFYNNMEFGDEAILAEILTEKWQDYAEQQGWGDDLNALDTYQWMQLIQLPSSELKYDKRLGDAFPEYDQALSEAVKDRTILELVQGGIGVCRDKERLNIASYVIADNNYNLAERGLLYYPMTNIADAKHTRGMFMVGIDSKDIVAVGVDTTNIPTEDLTITGGDTSAIDTSAWYMNDTGAEWIRSTEESSTIYSAFLNEYGNELSPTSRAIIAREVMVAEISLARPLLLSLDTSDDRQSLIGEISKHLDKAFQLASHELQLEEHGSSTFYLDLPVRQIHMLDGLLVTGRILDSAQQIKGNETTTSGIGVYQGIALDMFAQYMIRTEITKDEVEKIRKSPESIQFNQTETEKINTALQERLQAIQEQVGSL